MLTNTGGSREDVNEGPTLDTPIEKQTFYLTKEFCLIADETHFSPMAGGGE